MLQMDSNHHHQQQKRDETFNLLLQKLEYLLTLKLWYHISYIVLFLNLDHTILVIRIRFLKNND